MSQRPTAPASATSQKSTAPTSPTSQKPTAPTSQTSQKPTTPTSPTSQKPTAPTSSTTSQKPTAPTSPMSQKPTAPTSMFRTPSSTYVRMGSSSSSSSPYSITESVLADRLQKPVYGHIGRQFFAGFLACLSALSFGTTLGWTDSISRNMTYRQKENTLEISWLISIMLLGCSFGVTISSFFVHQMGPKKVLRVIGPFYIFNWWLILIPSVDIQLAGRFFLGFLGVSYSTSGELLLSQTVHIGIRKYITVFHNSTMVLGVLISRVIGTATTTFWLTMICATLPIAHYILIQIVPESPVFLYATSHHEAAKSLTWYRGKGNFYMDMANIKKDWDVSRQDSEAYRYMLCSKVVYRALFLVLAVTFFQVGAGYFIFMFYSILVLTKGVVVFSPLIDSVIVATCFVVTKMLWGTLHTVYNWKVRGFLIASCFFTAINLSLFTIYLVLEDFYAYDDEIWKHLRWIPMVVVCCYLFCFDMGLNHYPKILVFEYMPFQMYKRSFSILQSFYWMLSFLNIYTFSRNFFTVNDYYYLGVLSCVTFVGAFFCYFFVIEPKGKSLIQIQLELGGNPIGTRGYLYNQTRQTL